VAKPTLATSEPTAAATAISQARPLRRDTGRRRATAIAATRATTAAGSRGHHAGRGTKVNVPVIVSGPPSTKTSSANGAVAPERKRRGGASRWSCQAKVRPRVRRYQSSRDAT
jgi:hypothetical protein